jgi:transcriptional regulator with XRE-family HTH domain
MTDLVARALDDGGLPASVTPARIRAYLRARGIQCTPRQARELHDRLAREPAADGETLGSRLAAARTARGLTRMELARIAGCSESYLSYLEGDARSPSDTLLAALADAVRREPAWLRTGEESAETRRIAQTLRRAWRAFRAADWAEVDRQVDQLLDASPHHRPDRPPRRPLRRDELDEALLLRGRSLSATGRDEQAIEVLAPLVRRVLAGESDVPPVLLGQGYVRALINAADGNQQALAEAALAGQQLLNSSADERNDDWWRLAATLMGINDKVSLAGLGVAQGEWWLSQLGTDGEGRHPSGAAALYWNLSLLDVQLGRRDEALSKMARAVDLNDAVRYPVDGARVRLAQAFVLLAVPSRASEAVAVLESCREEIDSHGHPVDRQHWTLLRAAAELATGAPAIARRLAGCLDEEATEPQVRLQATLLVGDTYLAEGRRDEATAVFERAREMLSASAASPSWAHLWRDLGDRWTQVGSAPAAADAYRHALNLMHIGPSLPPH